MKKLRGLRGLLVVTLTLGVLACAENPVAPSGISNITWKLESIERDGSPAISIPNPDQYTIRLEDNGRVAVRADCNSCTGGYSQDGSSVSLSPIACTRAYCGLSSFDSNFAAALGNVRTATVSGNTLTITGSGFTLRFRS